MRFYLRVTKTCVFLFFVILAVAFLGCSAPSKLQIIEPEYQNVQQYHATLLVMPLTGELISHESRTKNAVGNEKTKKNLSANERAFFYRYFGAVLADVTTAIVIGIDPKFKPENVSYSYRELKLNEKKTLKMLVPSSGRIQYEELLPDFVLFAEELFFDIVYEEKKQGLGSGYREQYTLDTGLQYVLWDNKAQKIAAYGELNKSYNLMNLPTRDTYLDVLERFASSIIEKSPLVIKQTFY